MHYFTDTPEQGQLGSMSTIQLSKARDLSNLAGGFSNDCQNVVRIISLLTYGYQAIYLFTLCLAHSMYKL